MSGPPLQGEPVVSNAKPFRFKVDDRQIYWLDDGVPDQLALYRGPLDAPLQRASLSAITTATPVTGDAAIATDASNIYIGADDGIARIGKTDVVVNPEVTGTVAPIDIASDGTTLFWVTEGLGDTLFWRSLAGGPVTTIRMPDETMQLIIDPAAVYVRTYAGVYRVGRVDHVVTQLAAAADYESLFPDVARQYSISLARAGNHLEWIIHQIGGFADQDRGALIEIPLDGTRPKVVRTDLLAPRLVTTDPTGAVYWCETNAAHFGSEQLTAEIRRLAVGDAEPTVVVHDVSPSALAVSGGYLYWSSPGTPTVNGEIRRIALP
jgi:hypothetical protein